MTQINVSVKHKQTQQDTENRLVVAQERGEG